MVATRDRRRVHWFNRSLLTTVVTFHSRAPLSSIIRIQHHVFEHHSNHPRMVPGTSQWTRERERESESSIHKTKDSIRELSQEPVARHTLFNWRAFNLSIRQWKLKGESSWPRKWQLSVDDAKAHQAQHTRRRTLWLRYKHTNLLV